MSLAHLSPQEIEEFRAESVELIDDAEKSLLAIDEGEKVAQHYDAIFRAFHTLKGAAGMFDFEQLQQLMHVTETTLVNLKSEPSWSKEQVDYFLKALDQARHMLMNLTAAAAAPATQETAVASVVELKPIGVSESSKEDNDEFFVECEEKVEAAQAILKNTENHLVHKGDIDALYRHVHTIKGAAGLYQFSWIEQLCHEVESFLDQVRSGMIEFNPEVQKFLTQSLDLISDMLEQAKKSKFDGFEEKVFDTVSQLASVPRRSEPMADQQQSKPETPALQPAAPIVAVAAAPTPAPAANPEPVFAEGASTTPQSSVEAASVRIGVSLLDKMMALMGELVLVRNQVLQFTNLSDDLNFINLSKRLSVVTTDLQSEVMKTRMQPLSTILSKFQRVTRDLSKELKKNIDLKLEGVETEIDRTLIEAIKDPLMHLLRNSCDHGIEKPEKRAANNKPDIGTVKIRAFHEGGQVVIEVIDDGGGIDPKRILAKALEKGIVSPTQASKMSEREMVDLIFSAGFSTAEKITNVSGRGVGMDVVRSNIEKIGGTVEVQSVTGQGSTFRLRIPLTLAIVPAMLVVCEKERYAVPQVKLQELVRTDQSIQEKKIEVLQGQPVYRLRGEILPLIYLREVLGLSRPEIPEYASIVVVSTGKMRFGLIVDEIQDTADIVVKPLPQFLKELTIYSGATVMGDGSVTTILDVEGIAELVHLRDNIKNQQKDEHAHSNWGERQDYLIFKLHENNTRFAAILNLVSRIEEFPVSSIQKTGSLPVVKYRDGILPLFSVSELLKLGKEPFTGDVVRVLVAQRRGRMMGLVVSEIMDVISTEEEPEIQTVDRKGIMGNLVRQPEVTVILDLFELLDKAQKDHMGETAHEELKHSQHDDAPVISKDIGKGLRVLVIEDSSLFRKKIKLALEDYGFEVTSANDGLDGWEKFSAKAGTPNYWYAVISDIEMPRMTGLELAQKIMNSGRLGGTRLVALTSKDDPESKRKGYSVGFQQYLPKYDPQQLLQVITQTEEKRRSA